MIDQEQLIDSAELYLKELFAEVSGSSTSHFDSRTAFGELGIDSFHVLKIIKRLEGDFGKLPKSLLFERFNLRDLAEYFVDKHEAALSAVCAKNASGYGHQNGHARTSSTVMGGPVPVTQAADDERADMRRRPVRISEVEALNDPGWRELIRAIYDRYKSEGAVSRGTRKIAPNLFIGSERRGYLNYGRSNNIILVYAYTGPQDYLPAVIEEMFRYCQENNLDLNILADDPNPAIAGAPFSATPFGALQRINNLRTFSLEGGPMRRLRYQVSKFEKSGASRTEEYKCGSNPQTDRQIVDIIDKWRQSRTMVNPLVRDVRAEILDGKLHSDHRLFLTYTGETLQNAILITAMGPEVNGYLMDLEFYPQDMPLGGLEFAIVEIIKVIAAEGADVLSLGGTYGCELAPCSNADPEVDRILKDLQRRNIFNDNGNLQFKNKFRPESKSIYLCRRVGSGDADTVIDVIMMIADPERTQTPEAESPQPERRATTPAGAQTGVDELGVAAACDGGGTSPNPRHQVLLAAGFNPLNIPSAKVDWDLKTDSWAQLDMPVIAAQMRRLHGRLQHTADIDASVRSIFPFAFYVLTSSGQEAEHLLFKAWPGKGVVLQNLLFPSTILHQLDNGFEVRELPHPAIFDLRSTEPLKAGICREGLEAELIRTDNEVACVCMEIGNNAAGGSAVSGEHLRQVKTLLEKRRIPLVIDATRALENARLAIETENELADRSLWAVLREQLSYADAVIGSLTKDYGVVKGGIIATNDEKLYRTLKALMQEEGGGIDLIDEKIIAQALQSRKQIEKNVLDRMAAVRCLRRALTEAGAPVMQLAGGHCVIVDVKQLEWVKDLKNPVASFLAWLYLNTGIRANAHSVGMQKKTALNNMVRLAIPIGLTETDIGRITETLIAAFRNPVDVPDLTLDSGVPQTPGNAYAKYRLIAYHNTAARQTGEGTPPPARQPEMAGKIGVEPKASPTGPAQPTSVPESSNTGAELKGESSKDCAEMKPRLKREIAVVGIAGRYPHAKNPAELWDNLAAGKDSIEVMPQERYELRRRYGKTERYRGGFIADVDKFDSLFFNISPREAEALDPQERLFLETAWEALEDGGYYPEILAKEDGPRKIGVFVGAVWTMYQMLGVEEKHLGSQQRGNSFLWSIANRVSYWLNLTGPSLTLDTACSSSLTALYFACEAIQAGECDGAIVGGVNLDLHEAKIEINQAGGALSPDGVCRSFGKGANGYVGGEGIGAIYLKPLDEAVQDKDHIYGVIKSVAINHGGRTSGYTVPNPKAQSSVIVEALKKADISARTVSYIEAHGTGTELGDPIEIAGLSSAFSGEETAKQRCAIGSIKSNIGHLEAAAGIASVTKVLLQMKHRQLAPSLHSSELNEFIDFQNSPFYVVQRLREWKRTEADGSRSPLRAGISSFGAGGSNAHVIVEAYENETDAVNASNLNTEQIFPLSARHENELKQMAASLLAYLNKSGANIADVAYTLQNGRKSFPYRLAIIASSREELLRNLSCFVNREHNKNIILGNARSGDGVTRLLNRQEKDELSRLLFRGRDAHKIAGLWAEGLLADWQGLPLGPTGKRTPLPTYPFNGRRHWIGDGSSASIRQRGAAAVHPLIDTNESTFERQLFKKTFDEHDFVMYDHRVADVPTLPGVAYLELVRKAGEIAAGQAVKKIRNILWVSPIAIEKSQPKEVFIELKPSGDTVSFQVFSTGPEGKNILHSQGKLLYGIDEEERLAAEYVNLTALRAKSAKTTDGESAYPVFKSVGLNLGGSFQVLHDVGKTEDGVLGELQLPQFRVKDLESMVLHPSLMDGSLQAGMATQLRESTGEMLVPYSIGEVEILHPLQPRCFSYTTRSSADKTETSRVLKSDVLIVDETGKVLVKIRESTGVPIGDVHKKAPKQEDEFKPLYYSYVWEDTPIQTAEETIAEAGRATLLFAREPGLIEAFGRYFERAELIVVQAGERFAERTDCFVIDPTHEEDYARLFDALQQRKIAFNHVCYAWHIGDVHNDADNSSNPQAQSVMGLLSLCREAIRRKLDSKLQVSYIYSGRGGEVEPRHEAVNGFFSTLRLEHPRITCRTIEFRREDSDFNLIVEAIRTECDDPSNNAVTVRYQGRKRRTRALKKIELPSPGASRESSVIRDNGVYLITGGAGGLGQVFARFLADEYKARLILTGRSESGPELECRLEELRKSASEVLYVPADISNQDQVSALIGAIKSRFGALHGVIHAAGVVKDGYVREQTLESLNAVCAPKVAGTVHLDAATKDEPLDFFVTFSSLASVTGNIGQCAYGYANHFLDSFAEWRENRRRDGARSGKTLSIDWSLWADGGMRPDEQTVLYFQKTLGMRPLSAAIGVDAFVSGLGSTQTQFTVIEGIQEKLELAWGTNKRTSAAEKRPAHSIPNASSTAGNLEHRVQSDLTQIVTRLLKLETEDVSKETILLDLGFDSIGLTTFSNAINEQYELDLTPVLFFDYPSISAIAKYLCLDRAAEVERYYRATAAENLTQPLISVRDALPIASSEGINKGWNPTGTHGAKRAAPVPGRDSSVSRFLDDPIAIVGMSGVMPQSADLDEFWDNLKNSRDLITVVPADRWRWEDFYGDPLKEANKTNSKWGGFMKEIDKFDPLFFGISPREAQLMDPQQRIFLETVWKAVEDSGQRVSDLSGTRTGLFVGVATSDYLEVMNRRHTPLDAYSASGNSHAVLANRVSFLLNLRGPSAPIDTACSSSLIALHRAVESIHAGSCDMAIVGGVHVMLSPFAYISFSMAGMLSGDGRCKTFDKRANGYARGEGSGAIFLKRLSAAEADGNHVYAVIKSTAENHGGRVTTLTAPNATAQSALLVEAYEKAGIDPATVGYIECHGTGTSLGDPIEIQALCRAFSELYKKNGKPPAEIPHCGLSSLKTNIGHLETAAGIASVLKVLLSIKHRQIPATIHFEEQNPYINLNGSAFFIAAKLTDWAAQTDSAGAALPRRAGISSFGFGGANAHVVLEEYVPPARTDKPGHGGEKLIVLSAKNPERLGAYAESLSEYLGKESCDLTELSYTLQVGRDELPQRAAFVVSSHEELREKLIEFVGRGEVPAGSFSGRAGKPSADESPNPVSEGRLLDIAKHWVSGGNVDWNALYGSGRPRRIPAPTYPFARERHWIPEPESRDDRMTPTPSGDAEAPFLHPLLHRNLSNFESQRFSSTFSGMDKFLSSHALAGEATMPPWGFLEMARAAGELSADRVVTSLREVEWKAVFQPNGSQVELNVALKPLKQGATFTVYSDAGKKVTYCNGKIDFSAPRTREESVDLAAIANRCRENIVASDTYRQLSKLGLNIGEGFRRLEKLAVNGRECLATVSLSPAEVEGPISFGPDPIQVDGCLYLLAAAMKAGVETKIQTPHSAASVEFCGSFREVKYAYATLLNDRARDANRTKMSVRFLNSDGKVVLKIRDMVFRAQVLESQTSLQTLEPTWKPLTSETLVLKPLTASARLGLLGETDAHLAWLRSSFPNAKAFKASDNIEDLVSSDGLVWIAPDATVQADGAAKDLVIPVEHGILDIFRTVKALLAAGASEKNLRLTIIVGRAEPVLNGERIQPAHAAVVGFAGSLAKEYPQWDIRSLDVDSLDAVSSRECFSLPWDRQGNLLAFRGGNWWRQELSAVTIPEDVAPLYRRDGVYVVIGGAGGLGEAWSRFMVERYQVQIVWIGRRVRDAAIKSKIQSLAALGRAPFYIAADASSASALEEARRQIEGRYGAVHGVVHSAVRPDHHSIAQLTESDLKAALTAKVDITVNIDRVFGDQALDFVLFFSSVMSFFRSPGQAAYAAGSAFQDSFAAAMQARRPYPVKVVNWGYWGDVGFASGDAQRTLMTSLGLSSISPEAALEMLRKWLGGGSRQIAIVAANNGTNASPISGSYTAGKTSGLRSTTMTNHDVHSNGGGRHWETAANTALSASAEHPHKKRIEQLIKKNLSLALRLEMDRISCEAPFADYGVDSIIGVNLVRALNDALKIDLEPSRLFECNSINELSEYVWSRSREGLVEKQSPVARAVEPGNRVLEIRPMRHDQSAREPIAIIGMSARFGDCASLDELAQFLLGGRPVENASLTPDAMAGLFSSEGDLLLQNLAPSESISISSEHRLLLEECWRALEHSGHAGADLPEQRCGIYIGADTSDDGRPSRPASLLARYLNLNGPAIEIDAACSGSLAAIHYACQALRLDETDMAVAGGLAGSEDGQVSGAGMLVLKRLSDALYDGDCVQGVIVGSCIGRTYRASAEPHTPGRAQEICSQFGIEPATIEANESSTAAEGLVTLFKVLLSLQQARLSPLHYDDVQGRFRPASSSDSPIPRRAALASSGRNRAIADFVVEEGCRGEPTQSSAPGFILPLSANTRESLVRLASDLADVLEHDAEVSSNDISFTLFKGRRHFDQRLACVAGTREEAIRSLREWIGTGGSPHIFSTEDGYRAKVAQPTLKRFGNYCIQECRREVGAAEYLEHLSTLADLYVQGYSLDYESLCDDQSKRAPLPTYPFTSKSQRGGLNRPPLDKHLTAAVPEPLGRSRPLERAAQAEVFEKVIWREAPVDDAYEKITL